MIYCLLMSLLCVGGWGTWPKNALRYATALAGTGEIHQQSLETNKHNPLCFFPLLFFVHIKPIYAVWSILKRKKWLIAHPLHRLSLRGKTIREERPERECQISLSLSLSLSLSKSACKWSLHWNCLFLHSKRTERFGLHPLPDVRKHLCRAHLWSQDLDNTHETHTQNQYMKLLSVMK